MALRADNWLKITGWPKSASHCAIGYFLKHKLNLLECFGEPKFDNGFLP
jgi:hypothetical protein